jgi:tRNA (cmo5U34)-methyltransferase
MALEKMNEFFDKRADTYDNHMLVDLELDEFYDEIAKHITTTKPQFRLLDLGCGTGLELLRLFDKYPEMSVTGVDLSSEMLNKLKAKYPDKDLQLICGSYFDVNFENEYFDFVISTYSLHHFSEPEKSYLYKKVYKALKDGGLFVEGDYTCKTLEQQQFHLAENTRLRREQNIPDGEFYHYDTPFTAQTQINLQKSAGFTDVRIVKEWDNTSIIIVKKESII